MAARTARIVLLFLTLPLIAPALAHADDAQLIADLRECIERTDPGRGQDETWRQAHCPASEAEARQKLEQLLNVQKAAVEEKAAKVKKQVGAKANEGSVSSEDATADFGDGSTPSGSPAKRSTKMSASSLGDAGTVPALPATVTESGSFAVDLSNPCASIGSVRSIAASLLNTLQLPQLGLPGLPSLQQVDPALVGSLLDQAAGLCRNLLGLVQPDSPVISLQVQQEPPILLIDKIATDCDGNPVGDPNEDIQSGDIFCYEITVTNSGPNAATNVVVTDDWPEDFLFMGAFSASGTCEETGTETDVFFECEFESIAPNGGVVRIEALAEVPDDYCSQDDIDQQPLPKNTATVRADNLPEGPLDSYTIEVDCSSLHIEKTVSPDKDLYDPGDVITYTIRVGNWPKTDELVVGRATNVVVTDELSSLFQIVSVSPGCSIGAGNLVTCDLGNLEVTEPKDWQEEIVIRVRLLTAAGCTENLRNTAEVEADNEWPLHTYDNDDSVSIDVNCAPNVVITKTGVRDGNQLTYTITATNNGSAEATAVVVTDNLRDNLQNVQASASQGTCSVGAGNTVGCTIGTLAEAASATVTITARVPEEFCGAVSNDAEGAAENEPPGERGDNTDSATNGAPDDCVLGAGFTRVQGLAVTGFEVMPLFALALMMLAIGALLLGRTREASA